MHPNAFLQSLWRSETLDHVFVAMSFSRYFTQRFDEIIRRAIEDHPIAGRKLTAYRVDNSKSGDSILTEIVNGIAHARLVLADVSVIDEGRASQVPVRNGNVMYEVGIALACRTPAEVLLIRDDSKKFLFDVSTIPHLQIDFTNQNNAIVELRAALEDRLKETTMLDDARVQIAARTMTADELRILESLASLQLGEGRDFTHKGTGQLSFPIQGGLTRLLQKGCVTAIAVNKETEGIFYALTPFGRALATTVGALLKKVLPDGAPTEAAPAGNGSPDSAT